MSYEGFSRRLAGLVIDGVSDLHAKRTELTFDGLPERGALRVTLRGPAKEITHANNTARIP